MYTPPFLSACKFAGRWSAEKNGWVRPQRFTPDQLRALGSVRAWHPGLFRSMSACTSGVTLEFATDASCVSVELRMDQPSKGAQAVLDDVRRHAGASDEPLDGVSVDVDGRHLPLMLPDEKTRRVGQSVAAASLPKLK